MKIILLITCIVFALFFALALVSSGKKADIEDEKMFDNLTKSSGRYNDYYNENKPLDEHENNLS